MGRKTHTVYDKIILADILRVNKGLKPGRLLYVNKTTIA